MNQGDNSVTDTNGFFTYILSTFHLLIPIFLCLQISGFVLIFGAAMDLGMETIPGPKINIDWPMTFRAVSITSHHWCMHGHML